MHHAMIRSPGDPWRLGRHHQAGRVEGPSEGRDHLDRVFKAQSGARACEGSDPGGPRAGRTDVKALVTGGAGFIGHHLVRSLVERGDTVVVLDDYSTGDKARLASLTGRIRSVEGSILDPAALA